MRGQLVPVLAAAVAGLGLWPAFGGFSMVLGVESPIPPCVTPEQVLSELAQVSQAMQWPVVWEGEIDRTSGDGQLLVQFVGEPDVVVHKFDGGCLTETFVAAPPAVQVPPAVPKASGVPA